MSETCDCSECRKDRVTAKHVLEAMARSDVAAAEERGRRHGVEEAIAVAAGFGTFGQGLVKQLRTLLRHNAEPAKKATIAELEAILALPEDALEVYVLPNGEVSARPRIGPASGT